MARHDLGTFHIAWPQTSDQVGRQTWANRLAQMQMKGWHPACYLACQAPPWCYCRNPDRRLLIRPLAENLMDHSSLVHLLLKVSATSWRPACLGNKLLVRESIDDLGVADIRYFKRRHVLTLTSQKRHQNMIILLLCSSSCRLPCKVQTASLF